MGATDPLKQSRNRRGDMLFMGNNIIHGFDSYKSAEKEINLF